MNWKRAAKADLHVHLEGCMTPALLQTLAKKNKIALNAPTTLPGIAEVAAPSGVREDSFSLNDFRDFIPLYVKASSCLKNESDIILLGNEMIVGAVASNARHLEVYFTASTFEALGYDIDELFRGLVAVQNHAREKHNITVYWIFDIVRRVSADGMEVVALAKRARDIGVAVRAIGLAGYEKNAPAAPYENAFKRARELGFSCLAHAGETAGPESIWEALDIVRPARIGHGLACLQDTRLIHELRTRSIPLEVCPWSNITLGACTQETHPIEALLQHKLPIVLCSDDPGIFGKSLNDNYALCAELGVSDKQLAELADFSRRLLS